MATTTNNNFNITFDGKYDGLLNGFMYRNGKQHTSYNWLDKVDVAAIAASINVFHSNYETLLKEALVSAYKDVLLNDTDRPNTISWYEWVQLADSISVS